MSIESVMPSNHLTLCCPLLLLPSIFPNTRVPSNELSLHIRWPNYWSFSISPSNEYSEVISLRIGWFDLLAVQGTLKSLPQHHSSKASILQHSAFFMVQPSHPIHFPPHQFPSAAGSISELSVESVLFFVPSTPTLNLALPFLTSTIRRVFS